jgi:Tfp pilus assembly protein FimT
MRGFNLVEISIVVAVTIITLAIAIPQLYMMMQSYQSAVDARGIASQLNLARIRAASDFTQSQLNCNLTAGSCQLQICTTKGTTSCTTFSNDGEALYLSASSSFGYGTITTPAGSQSSIQNSATIVFNSRGIPVDSTGAATGNYGLYVSDPGGLRYAVTVYASGRVSLWKFNGTSWDAQ